MNSDRLQFKEFMKEIKADIKDILSQIPSCTVVGKSPLHLTDLGDEISKSLEVKDWVAKTALLISDKVKGKQPFEIQEFCFEYVNNEFKPTDELDNQIRIEAYNHGLTRGRVLEVFVVMLRDRLLGGGDM